MSFEPESEEPTEPSPPKFELSGLRLHGTVDETRLGGARVQSMVQAEFSWSDYPEEDRPSSVAVDYYSSEFEFDQSEMLRRWAGLEKARDIRKLFETPFLERMAKRVEVRLEKVGGLNALDPDYDEWFTNRMALLFDGLLEEEVRLVLSGREVDHRNVMTDFGIQREEYFRTQELPDRTKHFKNMEIMFKLSQLVKGKATQINENRNGNRTSMDDLRDEVRQIMAERVEVKMLSDGSTPALPDVFDGLNADVEAEILRSDQEL